MQLLPQEKLLPPHQETEMIPVQGSRREEDIHLFSLILSAADIAHRVAGGAQGGWTILVAPDYAEPARRELTAYEQENRHWPETPPTPDAFTPHFRAQSILIVASLMFFHAVTGPWSPHSSWFADGAIDSGKILHQAEYFRLLTALCLHADLVHLLGNCFLGGFLLHFFFLLLGNGLGMFSLLVGASLANGINVLAHGPGHHSVGFSTAVFTVIGILSALNYRHYRFTRPSRLLLPLMAGAAMLAMLGSGSGDGKTDLGAHLFGLFSGLSVGTVLGFERIFRLRENSRLQAFLWTVSVMLVLFSWKIATR